VIAQSFRSKGDPLRVAFFFVGGSLTVVEKKFDFEDQAVILSAFIPSAVTAPCS